MKSDVIVLVLQAVIGGLFVLWNWVRDRDKNKAETYKILQEYYIKAIEGLTIKVGNLEGQINMLQQTVESAYDNCDNASCKNFTLKKKR